MKRRTLAVVLALMMIVSVLPMAAFAAQFSDTKGHWAESSIDRWTNEGVLEGIGDNMYAPDEFITRAQSSAVFTRLLQLTKTADLSQYTDVDPDGWYVDYLSHAVAHNIFKGTSATTMNPDGYITRQDFFLTFVRAIGMPEQTTCNNTTLQDLNQVSDYAKGAVYALINEGYVQGRTTTDLEPLAYITRAEVAKILDNVISDYITADGSYAISGDGVVIVLAKDATLTGDFTGTIVGAAEGGKIDLAGIKNPVKVNAVKDSVAVTNAAPKSVITAADGVQGTTANGTSVAEDTSREIPDTPAAGGGGGGGGGGGTATYKVDLYLEAGGMKADGSVPFMTAQVPQTASLKETYDTLLKQNKTASINAISSALDKMVGDTNVVVDGVNYNVVITDSDYVLTIKNLDENRYTDLLPTIALEQKTFEARMEKIAADNDIPVMMDDFGAVVDALSPSGFFEETQGWRAADFDGQTSTSLTFLSPQGYYDRMVDIVMSLATLQEDLVTYFEWDADDFAQLFGPDGILNWVGGDTDNIYPIMAMSKADKPLTAVKEVGELTFIDAELEGVTKDTAQAAIDLIDSIFSRNYNYSVGAKSVLEAAGAKGVMDGHYFLSIKVS